MQVIVANINMHTALPQRHKPSQLDRMEPLLKDKPQKLGFKIVASPPVPYSMFTGMPKSHNIAPALVAVYDSAIEKLALVIYRGSMLQRQHYRAEPVTGS